MSGQITVEQDGAIARVTLDNPDKLNALSDTMWSQLTAAFTGLSADEDLRCVVITGRGERAFGAGADISEFADKRKDAASARDYGQRTHAALAAITGCRHPVVAEIHGLCVGGGLELAVCCDLRIAGESSRFGVPIKRLGLVVAYDEMRGLVDLIGYANTMEILLEGRLIDSPHALRIGLVNRIVADSEVSANVGQTAAAIAEGAPLVARWHKKFGRRLLDPTPLSAAEHNESYDCFDTEDFQTGFKAFLAKEKPTFKGR